MDRKNVAVVASLFVVGIIGFVSLGAVYDRERQVKDGVRTTAYFGGGRLLRTSAGEWTLEFIDSGTAITFFEPMVAFETGQVPIDEPFDGRIYIESLGRVVMLGLRSDKGLIYEALLRVEEHDALELIQKLGGHATTPVTQGLYEALLRVEGDDARKLIQVVRELSATAVPRQVAVTTQATASDDPAVNCAGGSCNCGKGKCSACCPAGKSAVCECGVFNDVCKCTRDTE